MDLYVLLHSVLMHVSAALVVLIYIPLSVPVKLFVWAFVKPFRKENLRGKVVLITGASSGIGEDVNFWGSVYPTYYALPHLKASKGKLIVCSSAAGTAATSRMSFYNATKAAQLRFYETLRAEFGSDVGVTVLTPGFVESEITQGKAMQKGGEIAVDEEARDVQIGVFPVGRVETFCKIALDSIRKGDRYVTWPSLYRPLQLVACLAPEVMNWMSYTLYSTSKGSRPLGQRMLEATGARRLYPSSLRHPGRGIKIQDGGKRQ